MINGRIVHQLIRTQDGSITEMTNDYDRDVVEILCAKMNSEAPDGVSYFVRTVEIHTRPLTIIGESEAA